MSEYIDVWIPTGEKEQEAVRLEAHRLIEAGLYEGRFEQWFPRVLKRAAATVRCDRARKAHEESIERVMESRQRRWRRRRDSIESA